MRETLLRIQKTFMDFPMQELITRMTEAGAWPPSPADRKLTPAALMRKYAPPGSKS